MGNGNEGHGEVSGREHHQNVPSGGTESGAGGMGEVHQATPPGSGEERPGGAGPLKIAIMGTAPGWEGAPFGEADWQIWGIAKLYEVLPRWDVWFEFHKRDEISKTWAGGDDAAESLERHKYLNWLGSQTKPVFMQAPIPEVPNALSYPLQDVLSLFPHGYFTNSVSWMLAFAILQILTRRQDAGEWTPGEDAIGVFGVDMALDSEYGSQRPSCEYYLGFAHGAGINVVVPPTSDLLTTGYLYAFQDMPRMEGKMIEKKKELVVRRKQLDHQLEEMKQARATLEGAFQTIKLVQRNYNLRQDE